MKVIRYKTEQFLRIGPFFLEKLQSSIDNEARFLKPRKFPEIFQQNPFAESDKCCIFAPNLVRGGKQAAGENGSPCGENPFKIYNNVRNCRN